MPMRARPTPTPRTRRAAAAAMATRGVALAAALIALGCGSSLSNFDYDAERLATSAYSVGPGDALQVRAWKLEALSQRVTVRPDGFITIPLVGEVLASGRTVAAIAEEIADRATKYYTDKPVVSVEVAELKSYRVYVMGEVARPGEFSPNAQITVLQAIALAGGFTRFAAPGDIIIVRRDAHGERRIPFAFDEVVDDGKLQANLPLQSNDTVVVP